MLTTLFLQIITNQIAAVKLCKGAWRIFSKKCKGVNVLLLGYPKNGQFFKIKTKPQIIMRCKIIENASLLGFGRLFLGYPVAQKLRDWNSKNSKDSISALIWDLDFGILIMFYYFFYNVQGIYYYTVIKFEQINNKSLIVVFCASFFVLYNLRNLMTIKVNFREFTVQKRSTKINDL